jgi:hypothetical protein
MILCASNIKYFLFLPEKKVFIDQPGENIINYNLTFIGKFQSRSTGE